MRPPLQNVLLVEDDADIRTVAGMALEMVGGLAVRACDSGPAALAALDEAAHEQAPQLILLDVMMPGMSGPEFLRELRARPQFVDIPVVFMTAKVQPEELQALRQPGVLDIIAKPFDPMRLADEVQAIWSRQ
jgi:CheY-like chemotaxis protein